jgi:hypothetical protein
MKSGKCVKIRDFYTINDLLSQDILLEIFKYCDPFILRSVCKKWFHIIKNVDYIWKFWYSHRFNIIIDKNNKWQEKYFKMLMLESNWINNKFRNINFYDNTSITACSLKNNKLITASQWGLIKIWNLEELLNKPDIESYPGIYTGNIGPVYALDCNNDIVVSGSQNGVMKIWNNNQTYYTDILTHHTDDVYFVKIINKKIISGSKDKAIYIYDLITKKKEKLLGHTNSIWCIDIDKNNIIYSSSLDGTVRIWKKNNELKYICTSVLQISNYAVLKLVIHKDFLIVGTWNGVIEIWSINALELLFTLNAHTDHITGLNIFNNILISAGYDNQIKIWKLIEKPYIGLRLVNILQLEKITCISSNSKELLCCSITGKIYYYNFDLL